jgi:hypothetical protein
MNERLAARVVIRVFALTAGWALAGCSVGTLTGLISNDSPEQQPPANAPRGAAAAAVDMAGRWVLAAHGGGNCGMNFSATAGSREGAIAPEGGCPGRFFTSRRWALEQNAVVIRNHAGEMLAQLNVAEPSRLEGQAANGEQVSLTR